MGRAADMRYFIKMRNVLLIFSSLLFSFCTTRQNESESEYLGQIIDSIQTLKSSRGDLLQSYEIVESILDTITDSTVIDPEWKVLLRTKHLSDRMTELLDSTIEFIPTELNSKLVTREIRDSNLTYWSVYTFNDLTYNVLEDFDMIYPEVKKSISSSPIPKLPFNISTKEQYKELFRLY